MAPGWDRQVERSSYVPSGAARVVRRWPLAAVFISATSPPRPALRPHAVPGSDTCGQTPTVSAGGPAFRGQAPVARESQLEPTDDVLGGRIGQQPSSTTRRPPTATTAPLA